MFYCKDETFKPVHKDTLITHIQTQNVLSLNKKKTVWPLFMDGVLLPRGESPFEEEIYFSPLSSQKFLVLVLSTSNR